MESGLNFFDEDDDEPLSSGAMEFDGKIIDVDLDVTDFTDETRQFKWPKSGLAWQGHYVGGNIPPSPVVPIRSVLSEIFEKDNVGERYYLSPNACKGILRRVDGQGRKLFRPLRAALEKESKKIKGM